jgi:4-amino-4-deoxy-L-arabinose transferase-like glycosyltransferase
VTTNLAFAPFGTVLGRDLKISPGTMWGIFCAGAASFVPLLFLQFVGEEAVYVIVAQEMRANHEYFLTTLYGQSYGRPGLYSLAILLLSRVLGEQHILIAARLITASATVLTAVTLAWLIYKLFKDRLFAAFGAAVFLSGDVLLQRGWLAYSDPIFSFFVFSAMACLWVAVEERRYSLLILAAFALIASFLTKLPTGYLCYIVLGSVLLWRHPNWKFLLTPWSISTHLIAIAFPILWNYAIAGDSVFPTVWQHAESIVRESGAYSFAYFIGRFSSYPLRLIWHLMPISAVILYALWSRKFSSERFWQNSLVIAGLTIAINLLPYWFVPGSRTRYIMPMYPLIAMCMTYVVLHSTKCIIDLSAKALIGTVGIAFICALAGYPLYEHYFRGSYGRAAQAIIARAGDLPIFANRHDGYRS